MKKFKLISIIVIIFLFSEILFAQKGNTYIGTSGLNTGLTLENPHSSLTGFILADGYTAIGIAPEIGYFFTHKLALGLGVGFGYTITNATNSTNVGFNPYTRYYFLQKDKFSFYAQLNFIYRINNIGSSDSKINYTEISITPGIAYQLSEHFATNVTFGSLGYFDLTNNGWFGLNVAMNALTLGLSYTF